MISDNNQKNGWGQTFRCSGIPMYPAKHPIIDKLLEGISEEYIEEREKKVIKFLNKHGFDLSIGK